jgi:predicted RNA-binding protein YlxR (DUF448 family)
VTTDARHVPMRTCVGCRAVVPKAELARVVRPPGGPAVRDLTGAAHGRGAYVHLDDACVDAAIGRGGFARALRAGVGPDEASNLRDRIRGEYEHT